MRAPTNLTLPAWIKSCPNLEDPVDGCAAHWPRRYPRNASDSAEPPVLLFTLFKNVRIADLLRFLEYHLLLGVDRAILVDNSCGAHAAASKAALAPYVEAGIVQHFTQFVCVEMRSMMFMQNFRGGSSMARQLSGMRDIPKGAFIISLDDDEYLALSDPHATLQHMRRDGASQALVRPWGAWFITPIRSLRAEHTPYRVRRHWA